MKFFVRLTILVVSIVGSLLILEAALHLTNYNKYIFPNVTAVDYKLSEKSLRKFDWQLLSLPKTARPNGSSGNTNDESQQLIRIVTIGDSYTFGDNIGDNSAYPAQLELILTKLGYAVKVYNYGASGFGSDHEYLYATKYVLNEVKPDILIWNFHLSDFHDNANYPVLDFKNNELIETNTLTNYLTLKTVLDLSPIPTVIKESNVYNLVFSRLKYFQDEKNNLYDPAYILKSQQKLQKQIENLTALGKERGFKLVLLLVPQQYFFIDEQAGFLEKSYVEIEQILHTYPNYFSIKNDFNALFKHGTSSVLSIADDNIATISSNRQIIEHLYLDERDPSSSHGWKHLNEYGNYVFANVVSQKLIPFLK